MNVAGYIGESTRRELEYARATGKRVRFLEPEHPIAHGFLEPDAAPAEPATGVDYRKISAALATAIHRAGETQRLPVFIYCKQAEGYHKTFYTDELTAVGIKWLACREWVQFIELAQEVTLAI